MEQLTVITPADTRCAFCAYLNDERPYTFLFRDSSVGILVTREQRGKPHLLVIPTRHVRTLLEVTDEEAARLAVCLRQVAKAIERAYGSAGIAVWQNNGIAADQTVGHVHFHVAGTLESGGTEWGEVPELSLAATENIAAQLRPFFEP